MSTTALMTVEQFARMKTADTEDYELVEGELVRLSSATPGHNRVRDFLLIIVWNYLRSNPIGWVVAETDTQVSSSTVRRPDLSVFLGERSRTIDMDRIPVPFAPDIAVEILSRSESAIDVVDKVKEYLNAGSEEVWLVDHTHAEVTVRTKSGGRILSREDTLESPMLPGLSIPVRDVFAGL